MDKCMPITHRFDEHIMLLTESAVGLVTLDDFLSNLAKVEARLPNNVVFLNLSDFDTLTLAVYLRRTYPQ